MITYFVELPSPALAHLFARSEVIAGLTSSGSGVAMAMLDLDEARAGVVRSLNELGVPVTAWLVLELSQGYWLTADNAELAHRRYSAVLAWAQEHDLRLEAMGLDIEVPHEDAVALVKQGGRALKQMIRSPAARQHPCSHTRGLGASRSIPWEGLK